MKIELTPDATAEDNVRRAVKQAKTIALRAKLDAAVAEGGENSADDVREYVRQHLDRL